MRFTSEKMPRCSYAWRAMKVPAARELEKAVCGFMEGQQENSATASQLFCTGRWKGRAGPAADVQDPRRDCWLSTWALPRRWLQRSLSHLSVGIGKLESVAATVGVV